MKGSKTLYKLKINVISTNFDYLEISCLNHSSRKKKR